MYASANQENLFFPLKYPTACLLGCVDVTDCLSQEDYSEKVCVCVCVFLSFSLPPIPPQYPEEESESSSDYVFMVTCPQELTVKFPIKGQHKICMCGLSH